MFTGVVEFKPPLVAGGGDFVGVLLVLLGHVVSVLNRTQGWDGDEDQGEDGGSDEGDFHHGVAMALLGGLGVFVGGVAGFELDGRVGEDTADDQKDNEGNPAGDIEHVQLRFGHGAGSLHRGLVTIHLPEVEIAPGKEQGATQGEGGPTPAGKFW